MKAVVNKRDPGTTKLDSINCFRVNKTQNKLFKAPRNTQYYPNSKIYKISCLRVLPNPRARISIPFARRPQQVLNRLSLLPPSTNLLRSLLLSCNDKIFLLTNNGRPWYRSCKWNNQLGHAYTLGIVVAELTVRWLGDRRVWSPAIMCASSSSMREPTRYVPLYSTLYNLI